MENLAENLNNTIAKIERNNTVLGVQVSEAVTVKNDLLEVLEKFQCEVKNFDKAKDDNRKTIQQAVLKSQPELVHMMSQSLEEHFDDKIARLITPLKRIQEDAKSLLNELRSHYKKEKKLIETKGVIACVAFCIGSLLSGTSLWYFFPQSTNHVYEFTQEQRRSMEHGALLKFAMKKLSKKERDKLWFLMGDSWKEYYEAEFHIKIPSKK